MTKKPTRSARAPGKHANLHPVNPPAMVDAVGSQRVWARKNSLDSSPRQVACAFHHGRNSGPAFYGPLILRFRASAVNSERQSLTRNAKHRNPEGLELLEVWRDGSNSVHHDFLAEVCQSITSLQLATRLAGKARDLPDVASWEPVVEGLLALPPLSGSRVARVLKC